MKPRAHRKANAVSSAGAIGLAQLMPGTAAELGVNPRDPLQNVMGGAKYLSQMINRFGDVNSGLRAYNQGPGNQERYPGGVSSEAVNYPGKVLAMRLSTAMALLMVSNSTLMLLRRSKKPQKSSDKARSRRFQSRTVTAAWR